MKALSVLICGCWLAALPANASGVTGTVVAHDSGEALGYADVVLYRSADSVFVAGIVSGTDGRFVFTSVAAGNYYVECRFIGYSVTRSPAFRLGSQKPVDLGTLYMHPSSGHLDAVVVEGRRPAYVQHLDKLSLGYELDALQTDFFYHAQSFDGSGFVADPNRTSDFTNHETCHSFYATLIYEQGRWGVLLGLRPEHMQIKSQLFTLDSIVNNAYFMVYPTLHTSYAIDGHNELRLSYSLRVNRPEADDLNHFPEYQNPLTLKAGNPYLKPEKVHSLEAAYQWKKGATTILGTVYYRYVTNKLTTITRYVDGNVLLTTKENLDNSSAAGAEVMVGSEIGKWLTLNVNGNLFYDRIDATRLGYASHKGAMAWSASMNAALVPFGNALLQLNSRVLSTALTPQCRREGSFSMDIGTSHTTYTIDTPQLQQRVEQRNGSRVFYFGVAWNFETLKHKDR